MKRIAVLIWVVIELICLAWLGVAIAEEPPGKDKEQMSWIGVRLDGKTPTEEGVIISRVFEDSPAAKAGLRGSDAITSIDGEPVSGMRELIQRIREHDPGSWIPMTAVRGDREVDLRIRLGSRPASIRALKVRSAWIGVKAIELPPSLREHFGAPPEAGVMISEVAEGSPAEAAGFNLGDVVHEVNGRQVRSPRLLRELVAGGGVGNDLEFEVARDGLPLTLETRLIVTPPE